MFEEEMAKFNAGLSRRRIQFNYTVDVYVQPCLKIPSNLGTILPIGLTKFLLKVALLAQDNSAMHDDKDRDQHDNAPPRIERQGEAKIRSVRAR